MSTQLKCLFCKFSGPMEDLRNHSATCAAHPAVSRAGVFREAMRECIKSMGGMTHPGVSDEFLLLGAPAECAALKRDRDTWNARAEKAEGTISSVRDALREMGVNSQQDATESIKDLHSEIITAAEFAGYMGEDVGSALQCLRERSIEAGRMEQRDSANNSVTSLREKLREEREIRDKARLHAFAVEEQLRAANALVGELRGLLERERQGWMNILGYRKLHGRFTDGTVRYGGLVREEIDDVLASINSALTRTPTEALEALKERLRREGAVAELRTIAAPYNRRATGCNPQLLLDAILQRITELQANHPDAPESSEEER